MKKTKKQKTTTTTTQGEKKDVRLAKTVSLEERLAPTFHSMSTSISICHPYDSNQITWK